MSVRQQWVQIVNAFTAKVAAIGTTVENVEIFVARDIEGTVDSSDSEGLSDEIDELQIEDALDLPPTNEATGSEHAGGAVTRSQGATTTPAEPSGPLANPEKGKGKKAKTYLPWDPSRHTVWANTVSNGSYTTLRTC